MQNLLLFFSKNISKYAIFNDQSFNDSLTNDIVVLNNWAQTGKQYKSWRDGSSQAVSSGSTLFANVASLVYRPERVNKYSTLFRVSFRR